METLKVQGNIASIEINDMGTANVEIKDGKVVATMSRQNTIEYIGKESLVLIKNVATSIENILQDLDKKVKDGTVTKEELTMGAIVQSMPIISFTLAKIMSGEICASADTRVTGRQFGIDTKIGETTTLGVAMNYSYAKVNFNRYVGESKSDMVGVLFVEIGKKIGWLTPFAGYSQDYLRRRSFNESEASWGVKADSKNYRTSNFLVGVSRR